MILLSRILTTMSESFPLERQDFGELGNTLSVFLLATVAFIGQLTILIFGKF